MQPVGYLHFLWVFASSCVVALLPVECTVASLIQPRFAYQSSSRNTITSFLFLRIFLYYDEINVNFILLALNRKDIHALFYLNLKLFNFFFVLRFLMGF